VQTSAHLSPSFVLGALIRFNSSPHPTDFKWPNRAWIWHESGILKLLGSR